MLRFFVLITVLVVWAIVGLLIYIPFLTRMIAYFSGIIVISTFQPVNVQEAQKRLDFAILLYPGGFKKILESFKSDLEQPTLSNVQPINIVEFLRNVAVDIVWALIFWATTLSVLF